MSFNAPKEPSPKAWSRWIPITLNVRSVTKKPKRSCHPAPLNWSGAAGMPMGILQRKKAPAKVLPKIRRRNQKPNKCDRKPVRSLEQTRQKDDRRMRYVKSQQPFSLYSKISFTPPCSSATGGCFFSADQSGACYQNAYPFQPALTPLHLHSLSSGPIKIQWHCMR